MRIIALVFLIQLTRVSFCSADILYPTPNYRIISDQWCSDVPPNKCRVLGTVLFGGLPLENALIATFPKTVFTRTDSLGQFGLMLNEADSVIYMYHATHGEIVMNPYQYKGGHEVVLEFIATNTWLYPECDKPVIYLSSPTPIPVEIMLNFKGDLTFSYPKYENGWNVLVNGDEIYDLSSKKTHPYLFWEGLHPTLDFVTAENEFVGFVLKTDTIVPFLESKLEFLGLNFRERTDFITYWAPLIIQYKYIVAQFILDQDYNELIASLSIYPKPDAIRRIFMCFKGFDERPTFKVRSQELKPFSRQGFTLIEWGGSDLTKFSKI